MVRPTPLKMLTNGIPKATMLELVVGINTKQLQD